MVNMHHIYKMFYYSNCWLKHSSIIHIVDAPPPSSSSLPPTMRNCRFSVWKISNSSVSPGTDVIICAVRIFRQPWNNAYSSVSPHRVTEEKKNRIHLRIRCRMRPEIYAFAWKHAYALLLDYVGLALCVRHSFVYKPELDTYNSQRYAPHSFRRIFFFRGHGFVRWTSTQARDTTNTWYKSRRDMNLRLDRNHSQWRRKFRCRREYSDDHKCLIKFNCIRSICWIDTNHRGTDIAIRCTVLIHLFFTEWVNELLSCNDIASNIPTKLLSFFFFFFCQRNRLHTPVSRSLSIPQGIRSNEANRGSHKCHRVRKRNEK